MSHKESYEEKIRRILDNKSEYNGNNRKAIEDVKIWLCCEWQCDEIKDMGEYIRLRDLVDEIAEAKIDPVSRFSTK